MARQYPHAGCISSIRPRLRLRPLELYPQASATPPPRDPLEREELNASRALKAAPVSDMPAALPCPLAPGNAAGALGSRESFPIAVSNRLISSAPGWRAFRSAAASASVIVPTWKDALKSIGRAGRSDNTRLADSAPRSIMPVSGPSRQSCRAESSAVSRSIAARKPDSALPVFDGQTQSQRVAQLLGSLQRPFRFFDLPLAKPMCFTGCYAALSSRIELPAQRRKRWARRFCRIAKRGMEQPPAIPTFTLGRKQCSRGFVIRHNRRAPQSVKLRQRLFELRQLAFDGIAVLNGLFQAGA